jgi:hypothetical protein
MQKSTGTHRWSFFENKILSKIFRGKREGSNRRQEETAKSELQNMDITLYET